MPSWNEIKNHLIANHGAEEDDGFLTVATVTKDGEEQLVFITLWDDEKILFEAPFASAGEYESVLRMVLVSTGSLSRFGIRCDRSLHLSNVVLLSTTDTSTISALLKDLAHDADFAKYMLSMQYEDAEN